jgi:hypothetical protein
MIQSGWKGVKRLIKAGIAGTTAGQVILSLGARRLAALADVQQRLGRPETILCLGNGPSSEDQQLHGLPHDCLFRVNSRWLERGFLTHPDVVFTGDHLSLRRCRCCLFGFRTAAEETAVLLNHWLGLRPGRIDCFNAERLGLRLDEQSWGARPTNGAVMVATAVALRPRRLIVAGLDLYRHPAGKYPGDPVSANCYARVHDADIERAVICQALLAFRGELIVVGEALRAALVETSAVSLSP